MSVISSLHQNAKAVIGVFARSVGAGTVNGTGIDRKGYDEAQITLTAGTFGAGATLDVKIQDSADNSTFADVTGAAFAQVTDALDEKQYVLSLNLRPLKRYIRVVAVTAVGTTPYNVDMLLYGGDAQRPITQTNTVVRV